MAKGTFGERLKRERELREVSLNELTKATRIGGHFLEALENEQWKKLPGGVFNRGFVRAIARYLGLNEEGLLAEYDLAHGETGASAPAVAESKIPRPPLWIPIIGVLVILGVLAGLVAGGVYEWRRYAARRAAKKSSSYIAVPSPSAGGAPPAGSTLTSERRRGQGTAAAAPVLDLSVSTSAAARVRIVGDGAVLFDAEMPAGETRHFPAKERFEVTASDSSAVLLELNGQAMPPVGVPGASGTIMLSQKDLRPSSGGNAQP
ncbi:MAG TPA: RodZ domain-containing protein [Candidatus Acidoferrum sp.]|nr:RodZ domain-containing protein [Candidatus Acidoferrum sp.]